MYTFPLVIDGSETVKHVFPTQQKAAQQAIELAQANPLIRKLIVFGSAVTLNCGTGSDLDLALVIPEASEEDFLRIAHDFYRRIASPIDLIHYDHIHNELLKSEIDKKGVVLYARND